MQVTIPKIQPAQPSTIIMVIGESATRSYMSAYNYKEHATTPWLAEMSASKNLLLFQHAYASAGQTVLSLERALTEKNQYNSLEFSNSLTIIDLAKKAGYTTYWFSGQGRIGGSDTPITLVANTADHAYWLEDEKSNKVTYDSDLLPYLKKLDPHQNNFVVFHIMGSHENYINRYPASFTKWGKPGVTDSILNYDNSLAFTDQFLKDVYTYAKDNLNLQAMLYFSDHGADPLTKRHPDLSGFVALRIPLALYLSPEYQSLYPETTATLKNHLNTYFTNDLIYELVAGILNIKSNHYDESNGLASPSYKYNRETLRTHIGKNKLTEDIDEH
jgi:heptose-I-phosphate ethanolaminephosphotransferase